MLLVDLSDELAEGYVQEKYDKQYSREKIHQILEFIIPALSSIIKKKSEENPSKILDVLKDDEKIHGIFRKCSEKIERPIVIYVASKFTNNKYLGTKIIEGALAWK